MQNSCSIKNADVIRCRQWWCFIVDACNQIRLFHESEIANFWPRRWIWPIFTHSIQTKKMGNWNRFSTNWISSVPVMSYIMSYDLWWPPKVIFTHSLMPLMPKWHVGQQHVPSTSADPLPWAGCLPKSSLSPWFLSPLSVTMWYWGNPLAFTFWCLM